MEYRKEDLMEAKKQIWGVGENMGTEESKKIWEENAQFWDNAMGDESNEFHRDVFITAKDPEGNSEYRDRNGNLQRIQFSELLNAGYALGDRFRIENMCF